MKELKSQEMIEELIKDDNYSKKNMVLIPVISSVGTFNGDPQNEGNPRTVELNDGTHSQISQYCLKFKIRNADGEMPIFMGDYTCQKTRIKKAEENKDSFSNYFDIPLFGLTNTIETKKNKDGNTYYQQSYRGCLSTNEFTLSICPVELNENTFTRGYSANDEDKKQTMASGKQSYIHALYCPVLCYSAKQAEKNGVTKEHIKDLILRIKNMLNINSRSSSNGPKNELMKFYIVTFPKDKDYKQSMVDETFSISPMIDKPEKYKDYEIKINEDYTPKDSVVYEVDLDEDYNISKN